MTRDELAAQLEANGNGQVIRTSDGKIIYRNKRYDGSSYTSNNPNHEAILIDTSVVGEDFALRAVNHPELDDPTKNTGVGSGDCSLYNLCVPSISVPQVTKDLVNDYDILTGKPKDSDYRTAEQIHEIADNLVNIPDGVLKTSEPNPLIVGDIKFVRPQDFTDVGYIKTTPIQAEDLTDKDFSPITKIGEALVTNSSVPCNPKLKYDIPSYNPLNWKDKEFNELKDKLDNLLKDDPDIPEKVKSVSNEELTDRTSHNGLGVFDYIASSIYNKLNFVSNEGLIGKDEIGQMYMQSLINGLQIAAQFALEKDKTYWINLLQKYQAEQAKIAKILAKAQLLMLPAELELKYAQLEVQRKQVELMYYQTELTKIQIHKEAASTDNIKEDTAIKCVQRKLALEELAQSEYKRKIQEAQIEQAVLQIKGMDIDNKLKSYTADTAQVQTQLSMVQLEQAKEDTKIKNTQWQLGLKQLRLADIQAEVYRADLKLKAQQLLKDREQIALVKAQTAVQYSQVTINSEQIKAAKGQYSDTIEGVEIGGEIGARIKVHKAQAKAFATDGIQKLFSHATNIWSAAKTADIGVGLPNVGTPLAIDRIAEQYIKHTIPDAPTDITDLPDGYVVAMSDSDFEGTAPTHHSTSGR